MVTALGISNKVWRGFGKASKYLGFPTEVYRPNGSSGNPIVSGNLITTIPAIFAQDPEFTGVPKYGNPIWRVIIDGTQVKLGDYLVTTDPNGPWTYFLTDRFPDQWMTAAYCNRVASVKRPAQNAGTGINGYGGNTLAGETTVLNSWPMAIMEGRMGRQEVKLPGDVQDPWFRIELPASGGAEIKSRDIIEEVSGSSPPRRYVVSSVEITSRGFRLTAQQALA